MPRLASSSLGSYNDSYADSELASVLSRGGGRGEQPLSALRLPVAVRIASLAYRACCLPLSLYLQLSLSLVLYI